MTLNSPLFHFYYESFQFNDKKKQSDGRLINGLSSFKAQLKAHKSSFKAQLCQNKTYKFRNNFVNKLHGMVFAQALS